MKLFDRMPPIYDWFLILIFGLDVHFDIEIQWLPGATVPSVTSGQESAHSPMEALFLMICVADVLLAACGLFYTARHFNTTCVCSILTYSCFCFGLAIHMAHPSPTSPSTSETLLTADLSW